jgi:hypothetical protein
VTRSDLKARITGLVLLLTSAGTTAAHRHVYEQAYSGPATLLEFVLSLLTFMLASTGLLLLLLHGGKLFWREHDNGQSSIAHASSARHDTTRSTRADSATILARQAILGAEDRYTPGGNVIHIRRRRPDPLSGGR